MPIPADTIMADLAEILKGKLYEQRPDPRTQAIERYMQEQGNDSRLPVYDTGGIAARTGEFPEVEGYQPDVSTSPNEDELAKLEYLLNQGRFKGGGGGFGGRGSSGAY